MELFFRARKFERTAGKGQRVPRYRPEIFVAVHQRTQPGVFELLGTPELAKRGAVAWEERFGEHSNGVRIEERAIGVKDERANWSVHGTPKNGSTSRL